MFFPNSTKLDPKRLGVPLQCGLESRSNGQANVSPLSPGECGWSEPFYGSFLPGRHSLKALAECLPGDKQPHDNVGVTYFRLRSRGGRPPSETRCKDSDSACRASKFDKVDYFIRFGGHPSRTLYSSSWFI